jgi:uncharacterized protein (TIRG00374 family)
VSKKLRLAASLVLLGIVAWRIDWLRVRDAFASLRLSLWLLATAVYALTQIVSSLRWRMLARPLGFAEPFHRFLSYYYIGMFFNLVLPTSVGGDVVRAWYLDNKSGRKTAAFSTVLADRISGVAVLLLIALGALVFRPVELPTWVTGTVAAMTGGALLGLATLFLISRFWRPNSEPAGCFALAESQASAKQPADATKPRRSVFRDLQSLIFNFQFSIFPSPRVFFVATLLSIIVQLANVLIVWLIGQSLHVSIPDSYYLLLVPTVTLLTLLPISLNGMGVREGGTALLLAPLGIEPSVAVTLAFLWFAAFVLPSLGGVVFYLLSRVPRFEVRSNDPAVGGDPDQGRAGQLGAAA